MYPILYYISEYVDHLQLIYQENIITFEPKKRQSKLKENSFPHPLKHLNFFKKSYNRIKF